eukprot:TRINITY_DN29042_c0_g1_i1.p1 TRINITY_DN29042_c0_g1~~TRINITY_DN29042_c0_g1_i1.p1  ORF type:complete len:225 (+),score=46.03 TRINITY_DN29042_c0_g1_i1:88-762(+)
MDLDSVNSVFIRRVGTKFDPTKVFHPNYLGGRITNEEIRLIVTLLEKRMDKFYFKYLWLLVVLLVFSVVGGFIMALVGVINGTAPFWVIHIDVFGGIIAILVFSAMIGCIESKYTAIAANFVNTINGDYMARKITFILRELDVLEIKFELPPIDPPVQPLITINPIHPSLQINTGIPITAVPVTTTKDEPLKTQRTRGSITSDDGFNPSNVELAKPKCQQPQEE